jgi:hypothetical protein
VHALLTSRYLSHTIQCAVLTFNTLWNDQRPDNYEVDAVSPANRPLIGFAPNGSLDSSPLAQQLSRNGPVFVEDRHSDARLNQENRDLHTRFFSSR